MDALHKLKHIVSGCGDHCIVVSVIGGYFDAGDYEVSVVGGSIRFYW